MGKLTISMAICNSYVKLPEGTGKIMQLHGGLTSTLHSFLLVYLSYRRLLPMSKHIAIGYPNFELGQACLPDTRYRHKTLLAKLPFCWVNSWNSLVHNFSAPSNPLGHLQNSAEFAGVNPPRVVFVPGLVGKGKLAETARPSKTWSFNHSTNRSYVSIQRIDSESEEDWKQFTISVRPVPESFAKFGGAKYSELWWNVEDLETSRLKLKNIDGKWKHLFQIKPP